MQTIRRALTAAHHSSVSGEVRIPVRGAQHLNQSHRAADLLIPLEVLGAILLLPGIFSASLLNDFFHSLRERKGHVDVAGTIKSHAMRSASDVADYFHDLA